MYPASENAKSRKRSCDFSDDEVDVNGISGRITRAGDTGQHLYIGAQIIRTDGLAAIPESAFSLNRLWDRMIAQNRAYGLIYPGDWCDIGTPQGLTEAETMLASPHV